MEKIIQAVSALDKSDDGIKLNQKYTHISSVLQKECTTAKQLRETYHRLNEQSLKDSAFAIKFAMLGSSRLFLGLEIFGQNIESLMMAVMKENFDNLDILCNTNIDGFYNSITLFAEFYKRAKTKDGSPIPGLVRPLIVYFKRMLELNTQRSAKEFTNQMIQNGKVLHIIHPDEISDLMILVRKHLLSKHVENETARMWLLLCLDLSYNNFCNIEDKKIGEFYKQLVSALMEKKDCTNSEKAFCSKEESNEVIVGSTRLKKDVQNHEVDKKCHISEQNKDSINKIDNSKNLAESYPDCNEINNKVNSNPIRRPVQNIQAPRLPRSTSSCQVLSNHEVDKKCEQKKDDINKMDNHKHLAESNNPECNEINSKINSNPVQNIQTPRLPRSTSSCQVLSKNIDRNKDVEIINSRSPNTKQNDVNSGQNLRRGGEPIVWGEQDSTMKKFSMSRSKSQGQLCTSRTINEHVNKENDSSKEAYDSKHNERKESSLSPSRVNGRLSYNSVMRTVGADSQSEQKKNCATRLLTPRERVHAQLSPHQIMLAKTQRLAIHKTQLASQQKANVINKSPMTYESPRNQERRRNNTQNKKTKAYLQDKNIENLTWNNSNNFTEFDSRNANVSPHFMKYLERD